MTMPGPRTCAHAGCCNDLLRTSVTLFVIISADLAPILAGISLSGVLDALQSCSCYEYDRGGFRRLNLLVLPPAWSIC